MALIFWGKVYRKTIFKKSSTEMCLTFLGTIKLFERLNSNVNQNQIITFYKTDRFLSMLNLHALESAFF
jgi:hypothetical protein